MIAFEHRLPQGAYVNTALSFFAWKSTWVMDLSTRKADSCEYWCHYMTSCFSHRSSACVESHDVNRRVADNGIPFPTILPPGQRANAASAEFADASTRLSGQMQAIKALEVERERLKTLYGQGAKNTHTHTRAHTHTSSRYS